jgi:hypothetical protein
MTNHWSTEVVYLRNSDSITWVSPWSLSDVGIQLPIKSQQKELTLIFQLLKGNTILTGEWTYNITYLQGQCNHVQMLYTLLFNIFRRTIQVCKNDSTPGIIFYFFNMIKQWKMESISIPLEELLNKEKPRT